MKPELVWQCGDAVIYRIMPNVFRLLWLGRMVRDFPESGRAANYAEAEFLPHAQEGATA